MAGDGSDRRLTPGTTSAALAYLFIGLLGVAMVFRPTLSSGFARMQAERGDTVFTNFVLEHQFQSLFRPGYPPPYDSLPTFHPARGTLYFSEALTGTLPVYAALRIVLPPFTAFQVWSIVMLAGSYAAMLFLLRRLTVRPVLAALGGFVFAFGMTRGAHLYQQHLLPAWCIPLALAAWASFRERPGRVAFVSLLASIAGQLFIALQLGWFLCIGMCVLVLIDVGTNRSVHRATLGFIRERFRFVSAALVAFASVVTAIVWPFVHGLRGVGWRSSEDLAVFLPRLGSWLQVPKDTMLSRILPAAFRDTSSPMFWEHELFPGAVPILFALIAAGYCLRRGSACDRQISMIRTCLLGAAALITVSLYIPLASAGESAIPVIRHGGFSFWWLVYDVVPGARGIRAAGRIWTVVHFFLLVGGFLGFEAWLRARGPSKVLTLALSVLIPVAMAEHVTTPPSFDKGLFLEEVARMRRALPQGCKAAYFEVKPYRPYWVSQNLAAWVAIEENLPVVNGYSSNAPLGYPTWGRNATREEIDAWTARHGVPDVCYVTDWEPVQTAPISPKPGLLPESAARVSWGEWKIPSRVPPGSIVHVSITLTNVGDKPWPDVATADPAKQDGTDAVRLGYAWSLAVDGFSPADRAAGRAELPRSIDAGETVTLAMRVKSPDRPGDYTLTFDLVQELRFWFSDRGASRLTVPVAVSPSP